MGRRLLGDWVMLFNDGQWGHAERFVFARDRADLDAMVAALGHEWARRTRTISVSGLAPSWELHLNERFSGRADARQAGRQLTSRLVRGKPRGQSRSVRT
ncbi:MAG: hypothetical protein M3452_10705, partial [Chloroflexota bacterium]|nr:hypothetical protein [Chloroflexota bacterium]